MQLQLQSQNLQGPAKTTWIVISVILKSESLHPISTGPGQETLDMVPQTASI